MKLISCHIENFGNLHDYDVTFDNITSFCEKNGFGKSTFAAFIKAMFYGLKTARASAASLTDREHYYPFEGGNFGGNITFEYNGDTVRIERNFDRKTNTADTLKVFVNGEETEDCAKYEGQNIFGLDEESFVRTIFISPEDTSTGTTDGVNAKLTGIVENTSDEDLKQARKKLDAEIKEISGRNGSASEKKKESERLKERLNELLKVRETVADKYESRKQLEEEISLKEAEEQKARKRETLINNRKLYDLYNANALKAKNTLEELLEKYPDGLPETEDINRISELATKIENQKSVAESYKKDQAKAERISEIRKFFGETVPTKEECSEITSFADNIRKEKESLAAAAFADAKKARHDELGTVFTKMMPDEKACRELQDDFTDCAGLAKTVEDSRMTLETQRYKELNSVFEPGLTEEKKEETGRAYKEYKKAEQKEKEVREKAVPRDETADCGGKGFKAFAVTLFALLGIVMAAGTVVYFLYDEYKKPGLIAAAASFALIVIFALICISRRVNYVRKADKQARDAENALRDEKEKAAANTSKAREKLNIMLAEFGFAGENPDSDYAVFKTSAEEYRGLSKDLAERKSRLNENEESLRNLNRKINDFYEEYVPDKYAVTVKGFTDYLRDKGEYLSLAAEKDGCEEKASSIRNRLAEDTEFFVSMIGKYGVRWNGTDECSETANEIAEKSREIYSFEDSERERENVYAEAADAALKLETELLKIINPFGLRPGQNETYGTMQDRLISDRTVYDQTAAVYAENCDKAAEFASINEIADDVMMNDTEALSSESLANDIRELKKNLASVDADIMNLEDEIAETDDIKSQITELTEEIETLKKKSELLTKTKEFLDGADETLRKKYIMPVQNRFLEYTGMIEKSLGDGVFMDKNFNVKYDTHGGLKDDVYLSSGQRSVESLCLRFAIIDVLYEESGKPFIILDDPFVYVDDAHMKENIEVLRKLSENYQIIYFCCHESRKI